MAILILMSETDELLKRRVAKVLPSKEGLSKLMAKRKIRLYQGFDPTGTRLHLGHSVGLRKLMEFAEAGHEVIFLFGTGTVLVGDPSLRDSAREVITQKDIDANIKNWQRQASKVVDFKKVTIKKNGDWLYKMTLKDLIGVASNISAVQLFKRDSFQRRLDKGDTVWYHETMYPLLQGYDSVVMDVDLEVGGTDQEFNMLVGRELQKKMNSKDKYVLTTPMILGTDGKTMSKSSGNCVWLDDTPQDMYGKLMSVPDDHVMSYYELCSTATSEQIASLASQLKSDPRAAKARMAVEITEIYHGSELSHGAAKAFDAQFKDGKLPTDVAEVKVSKTTWDPSDLLVEVKLAASKSEARRLLDQGGVRLNEQTTKEAKLTIKTGDVLQVGKRKFVKITLN